MQKAQFTPDAKARAALVNGAEVMMAEEVPSIPMFVRPGFQINHKKVTGPTLNPTSQGTTFNVELWKVAG